MATLKVISEKSGFTISIASRVLKVNQSLQISLESKKEILKVVDELG